MCPPRILDLAPLSDCSTFQLGGPARRLIHCVTPADAKDILRDLIHRQIPYVLIGGGSNLLISDAGVDTVVVRYVTDEPGIEVKGSILQVTGATLLDHLARVAVERGLDGLTMCSGIPGTVGGAIAGNAGAFGRQIGDVVESVELLAPSGRVIPVSADDLAFAYRRSALQSSGAAVLSVRLQCRPGKRDALRAERDAILTLRREKHPDWRRKPCIGSIFRNLEPTSAAGRRQAAGWFLEQSGAKDLRCGGAFVFPRHANIIVKGPTGTAEDVYQLIQDMAMAVKKRFGLELQREVRFLGRFKQAPEAPPDRFF